MHTITKRLYITVDGDRLVEEGDPDAQFLYAVPGRKISDEEAERFGLTTDDTSAESDTSKDETGEEESPGGDLADDKTDQPAKAKQSRRKRKK